MTQLIIWLRGRNLLLLLSRLLLCLLSALGQVLSALIEECFVLALALSVVSLSVAQAATSLRGRANSAEYAAAKSGWRGEKNDPRRAAWSLVVWRRAADEEHLQWRWIDTSEEEGRFDSTRLPTKRTCHTRTDHR